MGGQPVESKDWKVMSYGIEAYTHRNKEAINTYAPFNLLSELSGDYGRHSYNFSLRQGDELAYVTTIFTTSGNDRYISDIDINGGNISYTISNSGSLFMRTAIKIYAVIRR